MDFLRRFREIIEAHDTTAGYYGHASVGCLHIRPGINLKEPSEVDKMVAMMQEISDLVIEYERKGNVELMTIRSLGPDGLPLTKDDIVYRHQIAQRGGVEKAVEKGAGSVGRGLVKGVIDGVRENR